ncbi:MAG TPA: alpha/beta hydrolase-fold protein [Vicinamibacterales bacterium]|nr:alpha/beta hydrolase-fold protein [Vicinamibacterales bacterium]
MKRAPALLLALVLAAAATLAAQQPPRQTFRFEIDVAPELFPPDIVPRSLDGRVLLIVSSDRSQEPRFQVGRGLNSQLLFGIDVEGLKPEPSSSFVLQQREVYDSFGRLSIIPVRTLIERRVPPAVVDASTRGWPLESISQIPPGDYTVQAVLNVYTTFTRRDGAVIKAHMDRWEGQKWNRSPGNLYSVPTRVHIDPAIASPIRITLKNTIPPIEPPADTRYVKHITFKSDILSKWWGRDINLGAIVVLPEGFDAHPDARYPIAYNQGHFPTTFQFTDRFLEDWKSGKLGRSILVLMQHPTPFYDDSYAVNSANSGPYGDALTQELIPRVEKQFRAIAQPWARFVYGGSTGGWESLAWQVFYPDMFNGTWTFCPDPVDFRYFQMVNIYQDKNAFYPNSPWKTEAVRPWQRTPDDQVLMSEKDASHLEEVLGSRGRSGDQMDVFNATFGPMGSDGYPKLLYDKWTGVIDPSVAQYWKEHYDLNAIMQRDWKTLGPKLRGKLHLYVGEMDSYYLEEAAFLLKDFLDKADPPAEAAWDIGERAPHCYAGKPEYPGQRAEQRILPQMMDRALKTAPPGADLKSWRY